MSEYLSYLTAALVTLHSPADIGLLDVCIGVGSDVRTTIAPDRMRVVCKIT